MRTTPLPRTLMLALPLVLLFVCGCTRTNILEADVTGMPADEKAKIITDLWEHCRDGVQARDSLKPEELEERIAVLEQAYPFGKRGFEIAPTGAHQTTYWFARCCTYLGWDYYVLGKQRILKADAAGGTEALRRQGEAFCAKARDYLKEGTRLLLRYEQIYHDVNPDIQLYHLLAVNYELLEDYRSAFIVARKWLRKLEAAQKGGAMDPALKWEIDRWTAAVEKLQRKLIDRLEPIPPEEELSRS